MEYPMHIGGQVVRTAHAQEVQLPYDGSPVGVIYQAEKSQVDEAVAAAKTAAPIMREMTLDERSTILRKAYARLLERRDEMATAISQETGKPIKEGRTEVD